MNNARQIKTFIGAMVLAAVATATYAGVPSHNLHLYFAVAVLALAAATSRMKVKLPGINGNMSVNLPFILIALAQLSFTETVVIAAVCAFVQGLPINGRRIKPVQALFNVSTLVVAVAVSEQVFKHGAAVPSLAAKSLLIALAGAAFLLADTLPVAGVISLTENLKLAKVWREMLQLTFSYFVLSAGVAGIAATASHYVGWQTPLLMLPVMMGTYLSYKRYFRLTAAVSMTSLQFTTLPAGAREIAELHR